LARESLTWARRSVWALRPDVMEHGTLPRALAQLIKQLSAETAVQIKLKTTGKEWSLPREREDHVLRIGQEALTNALKHAQARHIHVGLDFNPERLELSVQDDGQGFDPTGATRPGGFGLRGLRERAGRIGGQLTVASEPGQGTRIVVQVPAPEGQGGSDDKDRAD
jgi:signal transduction histidine kinase